MLVAFAGYAWAIVTTLHLPPLPLRTQLLVVLGGTLLLHSALLPAPFAFSDDIFRYIWNGRVSAAGIDPYRYAPGDPALSWLRDPWIWVNVNAKEQPSPYPPLLEATFALIYRLTPESLLGTKAAMIALNLSTSALLALLLHLRSQAPIWALLYAWNPQTVFQVGFSGHNEPVMLFWLVLALLLAEARDHPRLQRFGFLLAAYALALATMAKIIPIAIAPVLFRRWGWRAAGVYAGTLAAVYGSLLFWRGPTVLNGVLYEAGTAQFNDGLYYLFFRLFGWLLPGDPHDPARLTMALIIVIVIGSLLFAKKTDLAAPLGITFAAAILLAPSVAPWYVLWVLPFVALNVLPRPWHDASYRQQLATSYWLFFSWSVTFSELFYFSTTAVWRVAHILVYLVPLAGLSVGWMLSRRQQRKEAISHGRRV